MKKLAGLLVLAICWMDGAGAAHACSCDPVSPEAGFDRAQYVFTGKVVQAEQHIWLIEVEQAMGDFTLPSSLPAEVLLIAGGSGITPHMAMLAHLQRHAPHIRATLVYFARSRDDRIFAKQLDEMASAWPGLRYISIDTIANTPTDEPGRASTASASSAAQRTLTA